MTRRPSTKASDQTIVALMKAEKAAALAAHETTEKEQCRPIERPNNQKANKAWSLPKR